MQESSLAREQSMSAASMGCINSQEPDRLWTMLADVALSHSALEAESCGGTPKGVSTPLVTADHWTSVLQP